MSAFIINFFDLNAQYTSIDNNTGYWIDSTDWKGLLAPGTSISNESINIYGEIISLNCLELNLGRLTIYDTLIINGNLILQNKAELYIEKGAVLLLFGDYTSKNKVIVNNQGTLVAVGNFEMLGSNNQGQFTNNGKVYIFDETPQMVEDTLYNDLTCIDTNDRSSCGYLTKKQFKTDILFNYYSELPFSDRVFSEFNNPCYELNFYSNKSLVCIEDVVEFNLSSIGIEPISDIWWQFGKDAVPQEAVGPGPHEVYFTTDGIMEVTLTDKFNTDLKQIKEIEVVGSPGMLTISKVTESEEIYIPFIDQVCVGESSVYTTDGSGSSTYKWSIPSLNLVETTSNKITANWEDVDPGEHLLFVQEINSIGCIGEINEGIVKVLDCKKNKENFLNKTSYAFSPNGDNINDTWVIPGIEKYPKAKIYVFNKNGEPLFISENNYQNDWDGNIDGEKLPFDSYYYIIDLSAYQHKNIRGIVSIFW